MADAQAVERPGPGNHSNNVRKYRPSVYALRVGKYKKTIYNWLGAGEEPYGHLPEGAWFRRLPSGVYEIYVDHDYHDPFVEVGE